MKVFSKNYTFFDKKRNLFSRSLFNRSSSGDGIFGFRFYKSSKVLMHLSENIVIIFSFFVNVVGNIYIRGILFAKYCVCDGIGLRNPRGFRERVPFTKAVWRL